MNAFWKGLVVSVVICLLVLIYCMVKLVDYAAWLTGRDHGLLDTVPGREHLVILGSALGVLVMFFVYVRPAQDG
jgi:hypothetical protein